jgi:hypothetical protein
MRWPATSSASERCARISDTDHLSGAGRLASFARFAPLMRWAMAHRRVRLDAQRVLIAQISHDAVPVLLDGLRRQLT